MWHLKNVKKTDQNLGQNPFGKKRFIITLLLTLMALSTLVYTNWTSYRYFKKMFMDRFSLMGINSKIPLLDEALTMSVNLAAATGDPQWKMRYDTLAPQLDALILQARQITKNFSSGKAALHIDSANLLLESLEKKSFELVQSGHVAEAKALLSSAEYAEGKEKYQNAFHQMQSDFWNYNLNLMKKERFKMLFSLLSTFVLFPLLLLTWYSVLNSMRKYFNDRKQAEESMFKSEKKYRELVENLNDVIFTVDIDGIVTYISPQVLQMYGYKQDEIIGRQFIEIVFHDDQQRIRSGFLTPKDNEMVTREFRYVTKNGDIRWAQSRSRRIMEDGHIIGIDGIFSDITERKKAQEALVESEAFLNSIIDSTTDLIWSVDSENFTILTYNKGLKDYFMQLGRQIGKGMAIKDLLPEESVDIFRNLYLQTLKEGFVSKIFPATTSNRILWINLHLLSRENKPYAISAFGKDITEVKEAENKIKNQLEELQRWNEATINREDRILELKQEVNELLEQIGKPPIYQTE
jgi:PAS domain S-box-containing protein